MTRVTKQMLLTDPRGRILTRTVEHLVDTGSGMHVTRITAAGRCGGCGHPVTGPEQVTGRCSWCGHASLCATCTATCGVCARAICTRCRHGFVWGRTPIAACPSCYRRLVQRAHYEQREGLRQASFARSLQRQQAFLRAMAMRMQLLRLGAPMTSLGKVHRATRR
jgi:hypothetical protein